MPSEPVYRLAGEDSKQRRSRSRHRGDDRRDNRNRLRHVFTDGRGVSDDVVESLLEVFNAGQQKLGQMILAGDGADPIARNTVAKRIAGVYAIKTVSMLVGARSIFN